MLNLKIAFRTTSEVAKFLLTLHINFGLSESAQFIYSFSSINIWIEWIQNIDIKNFS